MYFPTIFQIMSSQLHICRPCEAEKAAISREWRAPTVITLSNNTLRKTWLLFAWSVTASLVTLVIEFVLRCAWRRYRQRRRRKMRLARRVQWRRAMSKLNTKTQLSSDTSAFLNQIRQAKRRHRPQTVIELGEIN